MSKKQLSEAARTMGSAGGKIGGPARAKALTPAERSEIAGIASAARNKKLGPEERSAIARKAVRARYAKQGGSKRGAKKEGVGPA